jgi:hypothetical protein
MHNPRSPLSSRPSHHGGDYTDNTIGSGTDHSHGTIGRPRGTTFIHVEPSPTSAILTFSFLPDLCKIRSLRERLQYVSCPAVPHDTFSPNRPPWCTDASRDIATTTAWLLEEASLPRFRI